MDHINDPEPLPRQHSLPYKAYQLSFVGTTYLEAVPPTGPQDLWAVMSRRRSGRRFGPLEPRSLSRILWHTCKTNRNIDSSGTRTLRNIPSAGGLHPISILVQDKRPECTVSIYDPVSHALKKIDLPAIARSRLRETADSVLNTDDGTIFWLVADMHKVDCYYENGYSLVMRDAGILIGALCIVAEALELNACPLGICGNIPLKTLMNIPWQLSGVGVWVVGERK